VDERPGDRQVHPRGGPGQPARLDEREVLVAGGGGYVHRRPEPLRPGERREDAHQPLEARGEGGEELLEARRVLVDEEPGGALRRRAELSAARGDEGAQRRERVVVHQARRVVALQGGQAAHQGPPVLAGGEHGDQRAGDHQPQVGWRPVGDGLAAAQVGAGGGEPQDGLQVGVGRYPGDDGDPVVYAGVLGGQKRDGGPHRDPREPDPAAFGALRRPAGHPHRRLHGGRGDLAAPQARHVRDVDLVAGPGEPPGEPPDVGLVAPRGDGPVHEHERRPLPRPRGAGHQGGHPGHLAVGEGGLGGESRHRRGERRRPEDGGEHHHRPNLRRDPRPEEEGEESRGERRPGQHEEQDPAEPRSPRASAPCAHPGPLRAYPASSRVSLRCTPSSSSVT